MPLRSLTHLDDDAAVLRLVPTLVVLAVSSVAALGHSGGLTGFYGLQATVFGWHRLLGEALHRVGDTGPERIRRFGGDANSLVVVVVAAAALDRLIYNVAILIG